MSSQYPGPDPDDPFAKAPKEDGAPQPGAAGAAGAEETAPIQREETGYWERLAQEQAAQQQPPAASPSYEQNPSSAQPAASSNPWAGYGEPAGSGATPPPPPPPVQYGAQQPGSPYGYGAPGQGYYGQAAPPNDGLGIAAMVVGIASFVLACLYGIGLLGSPVALVMGRIAVKRIDRSEGRLGGRGMAQAGFIMGIIGTVLLVLLILVVAVIVVVAVNGGFDSSSSYDGTQF